MIYIHEKTKEIWRSIAKETEIPIIVIENKKVLNKSYACVDLPGITVYSLSSLRKHYVDENEYYDYLRNQLLRGNVKLNGKTIEDIVVLDEVYFGIGIEEPSK